MARRVETFSAVSHGVGALLGVAGLAVLLVLAGREGDPWRIVGVSVYGTTLVLVYLVSTLYHCTVGRARETCRRLDHLAIYLLIAGTYTPFTLVSLRGGWGWSLFGSVWGLALLGFAVEGIGGGRFRAVSVALYVCMGWIALVALGPIVRALPAAAIMWLLAGGGWYTAGVAIYMWRALPRNHEIWHLCVLAGSACHYLVVLLYLE